MYLINILFSSFEIFFSRDVPDILHLISRALKNAPFPASYEELLNLNRDQMFQLLPIVTALLVVLIIPFALILKGSASSQASSPPPTYWLTRELVLRGMGAVYFFAFLTAAMQNRGLFSSLGLNPVDVGHRNRPSPLISVLERMGVQPSDAHLEAMAWSGVLGACFMMDWTCTFVVPLFLWLNYLSLVNLGTIMMNYGWEWLTLEAGFLAIFLCPLYANTRFPSHCPPSSLVLWLFRWLLFRLMIGAGMSKMGLGSSPCWKDLTCTEAHYYTMPMPNPFAWFAHQAPPVIHHIEVAVTFFEQLVLPFFVFIPFRSVHIFTSIVELFFQFAIAATGNYAWVNLISTVPSFSLLDDKFLRPFFSETTLKQAEMAQSDLNRHLSIKMMMNHEGSTELLTAYTKRAKAWAYIKSWIKSIHRNIHTVLVISLVLMVGFKSAAPIKELFVDQPWLHYYDDYFLVNAQGLFGFVNLQRTVMVLEMSHSDLAITKEDKNCVDSEAAVGHDQNGHALYCSHLANYCDDPQNGRMVRTHCPLTCGDCVQKKINYTGMEWVPLRHKNLPNDVDRSPWFNAPYHQRLDWEIWIYTTASMENVRGKLAVPGIVKTQIAKILAGDTDAIGLSGFDDFFSKYHGKPPTAVRATFYRYKFTTWGSKDWWTRTPIPKQQPQYFVDKWQGPIVQSPLERSHVLFCLLLAFVFSLRSLCWSDRDGVRGLVVIIVLCSFALSFGVDYPDRMPYVAYFSHLKNAETVFKGVSMLCGTCILLVFTPMMFLSKERRLCCTLNTAAIVVVSALTIYYSEKAAFSARILNL